MNDRLTKYENDEISNDLLLYLRRNFNVSEHSLSFVQEPYKMINIFGKNYFLKGNKKFLVNKIYSLVEDKFDIEEKEARRTIKMFLDGFS